MCMCVCVIVPDWMRPLFSMREGCAHIRTHTHQIVLEYIFAPTKHVTSPIGPRPDPLLHTQTHTPFLPWVTTNTHTQATCDTLLNHTRSPHPYTNTFYFLFETVNTHQTQLLHKALSRVRLEHTHLSVSSWCVCRGGSGWEVRARLTANADERGRK